jgi:hypothetical protein
VGSSTKDIKYQILAKDTVRNTVQVLLNFTNPSNISATTEPDILFVNVIDRVESKKTTYYSYLMENTNSSRAIPPQVNSGKCF